MWPIIGSTTWRRLGTQGGDKGGPFLFDPSGSYARNHGAGTGDFIASFFERNFAPNPYFFLSLSLGWLYGGFLFGLTVPQRKSNS
jgi:hypothetical protein